MKLILAILLFLSTAIQAQVVMSQGRIICDDIRITGDRLASQDKIDFAAKDGTASIDLVAGKVVLDKVTLEDAAKQLWTLIGERYPELTNPLISAIGATPTKLQIQNGSGKIILNLKTGAVNWPGKTPDAEYQLFLDAVVLAFPK